MNTTDEEIFERLPGEHSADDLMRQRNGTNGRWSWILALIACLPFALFLFRPAILAQLTVIPTECWLIGGVALQLLFVRARRRRGWQIATCVWVVFAVMFIEPIVSLPRDFLPRPAVQEGQSRLRVVSLNCHAGNRKVLETLLAQKPDLVLLQESPGRATVEKWTRELFGEEGSVLWNRDSSILARGRLIEESVQPNLPFTQGLWQPTEDWSCRVISLRLWPQPFRFDYWNSASWQSYREVREIQVAQMREIANVIDSAPADSLWIVGGDFNCPPRDPAELDLPARGLIDQFSVTGRGWGKTISDDFPFHRIDRIWASPAFRPLDLQVIDRTGSDHRLVRCDMLKP